MSPNHSPQQEAADKNGIGGARRRAAFLDTVGNLVAGSGMRFDARGIHTLEGVPEPWELYSLAKGHMEAVAVVPEPPATGRADRMVLATARRAPAILRLAGRVTAGRRGG
jgi:hypothetical protein